MTVRFVELPLSHLPIAQRNSIQPSDFPDEVFDLYSVPAHESGRPEVVRGSEVGSHKQIVEPGMVLLSKINPRISRVWVVGSAGGRRQIASTEWLAFERSHDILPHYLAMFLRQYAVRDYLAANASGVGGSLMRVKASTLGGIEFKLCGRGAQAAIVAKVEELLSELDAGVAELKAAQAKLQRYRQSLLKAAVQGDLTAEWRASNPPTESGADLLQRILAERRSRWEAAQRAKAEAAGKQLPKGWQGKYPEPFAVDAASLPPLPDGWIWTSLDALIAAGPQNGLYLPKSLYGRGTSILRIDDYQIGWHRPREALQLVQADADSLLTYGLNAGDLVVNRVNSMTHLGKCLMVTAPLAGALFESNMMRMTLSALTSAEYIARYLGSDIGRGRLTATAKWAVNQASINQHDACSTPIPLPPLAEQVRITELLAEQLAAADEQAKAITQALAQSTAQRQNILRGAFAGQLVPKDPVDEPAEALLARIRARRTNAEATEAAGKRRARGRGDA